MGKKGKNTAKKKAARQEAKAAEKEDRELKKNLPAKLDALLAKAQEETKDIDLFAEPPPKEECAICLHPHSIVPVGEYVSSMVHSCCGKKICRGCMHAKELAVDKINRRKKKNEEPLVPHTCAFCREPKPCGYEEEFSRLKKRAELIDVTSIYAFATLHYMGLGTPKSEAKALDLFCRAAELGEKDAYHKIGLAYHEGTSIIGEDDEHKSSAFHEIAAKKGHILSRHNLGIHDLRRRNNTRAVRHFKIAAEAGLQESLDILKMFVQVESDLIGRDELAEILEKCLASQAEMKTDQRDAWEKVAAAEQELTE